LVTSELADTLPPSSGLASEEPSGKPYFKIRWHNGRTNYYPIEKERVVIGRGPEADLRVPENLRFVSGRHAEVRKKEAGYFVRDLNSTNGTLVNNQPLQPGRNMRSAMSRSSASATRITAFRSGSPSLILPGCPRR
jgi:hypothetical protein